MIQIAFNRFHEVCKCVRLNLCVPKTLVRRISPEAAGGTNFSGGTNNVLKCSKFLNSNSRAFYRPELNN